MNFKAVLITACIWFPALATAYYTDSGTFLICNSSECIRRAKLINESLNTTIDPCMDFYSYVCNLWESNHQYQILKGSYDVYQEIGKDIPKKLSYILGNRTLVESDQTIIDKAAIMYRACLAFPDTPHALIRVLNESGFNAWPILTEENIFSSSNSTDLLRHMNISAIFNVLVVDMKRYARNRASPYEITIDPVAVQEEIMKLPDIRGLISNAINIINPGIDDSMVENLTNQLVEFAGNLSEVRHRSLGTTRFKISSLEEKFPNIPIYALLKKEFEKVNITLNDTEEVKVHTIYCEKLSAFLESANPNTLYNYAGFLAIFSYIQYVQMSTEEVISSERTPSTPKDHWTECMAMLRKSMPEILDYLYVTSVTNHTAIKKEVQDMARQLKEAFNETLQNNRWIDNKTREVLEKKLKKVTLRIGYPDALLDISALQARYKYVPLFSLNISFSEALYHIRENAYKMQLNKFRYPEEGKLSWEHSSTDLRTFYDDYGPKIEIPYALFVSPLFELGLPRSLNYGGIGSTIAHELLYSFSYEDIHACQDIPKRQCNISENSFELFNNRTTCFMKQYRAANEKLLVELDDNYNESISAQARIYEAFFSKRSQYEECYDEAFRVERNARISKEVFNETLQNNGSIENTTQDALETQQTEEPSGKSSNASEECLTYWKEYVEKLKAYKKLNPVHWREKLNEDLADNTGLQTTYKAYEKVLEDECAGIDTRLAGLKKLSGLQLFFISYARPKCRIADKGTLVREIRAAKYSTAQNRVNEPMKNLEAFAKAFNCPLGSPMHPLKNETCSLW